MASKPTGEPARTTFDRRLESLAQELGLTTERHIAHGDPADAILAEAAASGASLIVVPFRTHDHDACSLGRGAVERLLRQAMAPIVLVPAVSRNGPLHRTIRRLLVPLDGAPFAEAALVPATKLARSMVAEVFLVHIVRTAGGPARYSLTYSSAMQVEAHRYLAQVASRLRADGLDVQTETAAGFVGPAIAAIAYQRRVDMIVLATQARGGLAQLLGGRIAMQILHHAPVPVMVVGPNAAVAPWDGTSVDACLPRSDRDGDRGSRRTEVA